jgi:hypothetical protein
MSAPVKLYLLDVSPIGSDMPALHDILLQHPAIRTVISFDPFAYFIKSDRPAEELARLVKPLVSGLFLVMQINPANSAGEIPITTWFDDPAPPPRGDGHQPSEADVLLLPPLDVLMPTVAEARLQALIAAEPKGQA